MDRGITFAGVSYQDAANLGSLNGFDIPNANINLQLTGQLALNGTASGILKTGAGTLTFAIPGVTQLPNCDFQVRQGTVVFASGTYNKTRVNINFQDGAAISSPAILPV